MDFTLSDDQQFLMTSFEALLDGYRALPTGPHGYVLYSEELQSEIEGNGFLRIAAEDDFGTLEAAMLVEAAATSPYGAEVATSALVGPLLGDTASPIALSWGVGAPSRYLSLAQTVCLFEGEDVHVGRPDPSAVQDIDAVVAYPLGRLDRRPLERITYTGAEAGAIRRRALIGIVAEAAGLMRAALENTVSYVKERQQFGQPLGHLQAIQHRLAEDLQIVRACRSLAFRAAYLDDDWNAAVACLYAQNGMRKVVYDCHQFSGAMGLTLEFPLHLWTYRLKYLQGEAGGRATQARIVARHTWQREATRQSETTYAEGMA